MRYKRSLVIQLFDRIDRLQFQDEYHTYLQCLKSRCLYLLLAFFTLLLFGCPSYIYNRWYGPFHLNLDAFISHWNSYSENSSSPSEYFFAREYLQIELGENRIDVNPERIFRMYYRHPNYNTPLYTFHPISEPNITTVPMQLFVKLPTEFVEYFHERLPYRFDLFHSDTLKCIAQQIDGNQSNIDVRLIEEIYDRNATDFNMKVITKCGILLGYLYDCANEKVYTRYSNEPYIFTFSAAAFNASTSYSSYATFAINILLILWGIEMISKVSLQFFRYMFQKSSRKMSNEIQSALTMVNIDSIRALDRLVMGISEVNNYNDRLFLIREKYLLIFRIDLNEHDPSLLRQFYTQAPFSIIDLDCIIEIKFDRLLISNGVLQRKILFLGIDHQRNQWLHRRLMNCSTNYRQQQMIRTKEAERRYWLNVYLNEEEEIQRTENANDFERIQNRVTSASPRFIAQFRLDGPETWSVQRPKTKCVICLEFFLLGDHYSRWPCAAQHTFHYECILILLRKQNQCPLCRHAVEPANLPTTNDMFNIFLSRENLPWPMFIRN